MFISFIIGSTKLSGAENVMSALARHFIGDGHRIAIILTGEAAEDSGFETYHVTASGPKPVRIVRRLRALRSLVARLKPDVTISFGHANNMNSSAALFLNGVPHFNSVRTYPYWEEKTLLGRLAMKLVYSLATGSVFQTEVQQALFPVWVRSRSAVIRNPITTEVGDLKADASSKVISALGRLRDADKNYGLLIRSFATLAQQFPDWTLQIHGEGQDRSLYEELIGEFGLEEQIILMGSTETALFRLAESSIFAMPSRVEGMPNALIEAQSLGLACVATDCSGGGSAAIIEDEQNGLIVPNEDQASFTSALRRLIEDRALRERLGEEARLRAERFSINTVYIEWLRVVRGTEVRG